MRAQTASSAMNGIFASNDSTSPAPANTAGGNGVFGESQVPNASGVFGFNANGGNGVAGISQGGIGVFGQSNSLASSGVLGMNNVSAVEFSNGSFGVTGVANGLLGTGVQGIATGGGGTGVFGQGGSLAGAFAGDVGVTGKLTASQKLFKIDHPLDPANRYLLHAVVEAPEMMNLYSGNVTTDSNGDSTVSLPGYFEAINGDFRYQLTVLGQMAQAVIASEIQGRQFTIKTDKPNVKVSWQVTAIRQDLYAKANPMVAEQDKPAAERGSYLHPELYGQPEEKRFLLGRNPKAFLDLEKALQSMPVRSSPTISKV
jgi:hypothetical protein